MPALDLVRLLDDGLVELYLRPDDSIGYRLTVKGQQMWDLLRRGVVA